MGRKSDAKQRLLDAALSLIWENSYGVVTIDAICEKAGVKKGSFYYFFESKSDLAVAALDELWQVEIKPKFDAMFSASNPPLERIRLMMESAYDCQKEMQQEYGKIIGCACFSLGSEVCTQNDPIRQKVQETLCRKVRYLESAIRDAQADGLVAAGDPLIKAKALYTLYEGSLTEARIQNSLDPLRILPQIVMDFLGVPAADAARTGS
ncbi:TetR/AcrR family transcriptional regulator [Luteolibacter sp. GHJ8]|uniref:TetR/AcrR family transcriptional regulator n=1 Tax=Luteolibacter rhizosphaerae TaxID=2989719 RepID=A0ABT3FZ00_9BACT|nr:TetR/AcrR family transcriptional regulator [Luteolibacter rhizosphaerae]MCW1912803.1 TetR/AcrR family transcriptional regulator [Luteolibacter rhizosphaerae]